MAVTTPKLNDNERLDIPVSPLDHEVQTAVTTRETVGSAVRVIPFADITTGRRETVITF